MDIKFRPHHFLCALGFKGRGYSPAFVSNFHAIMALLNGPNGEETLIHVVQQTDSICQPCPHRVDNTCQTEENIAVLDQAHASALDIKPNEKITWGQAKKRIANKITLEKFHHICATCSWKSLGICEDALKKIK